MRRNAKQSRYQTPGAEYFVKFSFYQKKDTEWAKAGYEVAADQMKLSDSEKPIFSVEAGKMELIETPDAFTVKGVNFEATFSKKEGTLSKYLLNEVSLISKGPQLNVFRAPTDNDKQVDAEWF